MTNERRQQLLEKIHRNRERRALNPRPLTAEQLAYAGHQSCLDAGVNVTYEGILKAAREHRDKLDSPDA